MNHKRAYRLYRDEGLNLSRKRPRRHVMGVRREGRSDATKTNDIWSMEYISKALDLWAYENGATLDFFRPGKPSDNAYIESFNGSFRDECLNVNWFLPLMDALEKIEARWVDYKAFRPHYALGDHTLSDFARAPHKGKPDSPARLACI